MAIGTSGPRRDGAAGALSDLFSAGALGGLALLAVVALPRAPAPLPQASPAPAAVTPAAAPAAAPRVAPAAARAAVPASPAAVRSEDPHEELWPSVPRRVDPGERHFPRVAAAAVPPAVHYDLTLTVPPSFRTVDSASFVINGKTYRLDGLEPIPPDHICKSPQGSRTACGRRGLVALRRELAGKTLACRQTGSDGAVTLIECGGAGLALSVRMVRDGFAKASAKAPQELAAAADEARRGRVGIWGEEGL